MNDTIMNPVERSKLRNFCWELPEPTIAKPIAAFAPGGGLTLTLQYGEQLANVTDDGLPCKFGSLHSLLHELAEKENLEENLTVNTANYWASSHCYASHTLRRNDPQRIKRATREHGPTRTGQKEAQQVDFAEDGVMSVDRADLDHFCRELPASIIAKPVVAFTRGGGMTLWLECGKQRVNVTYAGEPCNFGSLDALMFELAGKKNIEERLTVDTAKYWSISHY